MCVPPALACRYLLFVAAVRGRNNNTRTSFPRSRGVRPGWTFCHSVMCCNGIHKHVTIRRNYSAQFGNRVRQFTPLIQKKNCARFCIKGRVPSSWALSPRKTAKRKMLSKNRKRGMCSHLPREGPLGSTTVSVGLLVFGGHRDDPYTDPLVKCLKTSISEKMCTSEMSPIAEAAQMWVPGAAACGRFLLFLAVQGRKGKKNAVICFLRSSYVRGRTCCYPVCGNS